MAINGNPLMIGGGVSQFLDEYVWEKCNSFEVSFGATLTNQVLCGSNSTQSVTYYYSESLNNGELNNPTSLTVKVDTIDDNIETLKNKYIYTNSTDNTNLEVGVIYFVPSDTEKYIYKIHMGGSNLTRGYGVTKIIKLLFLKDQKLCGSAASNRVNYLYSTNLNAQGELMNPTSIIIGSSNIGSNFNTIKGKYVMLETESDYTDLELNQIYYIPSYAEYSAPGLFTIYYTVNKINKVSSFTPPQFIEYKISMNSEAYPDDEIYNGYYYKSLGKVEDIFDSVRVY